MIRDHVEKRGHERIEPTARRMRYWWARINEELFEGMLHTPQLGVEADEDDNAALCTAIGHSRVRITLDPEHNTTRQVFLESLCHEMVHQWQHESAMDLDHSESFTRWVEPAQGLLGLTIMGVEDVD